MNVTGSTMDQGALRASVARSALFSQLSETEIAVLFNAAMLRRIQQGQVLFHQGDPPNYLFQIVGGLLRITQINSDGEQITLRIARPGDLCCVAALRRPAYPATAIAIKDATVLVWRACTFLDLARRHPGIADNVLSIVGDRAHEMLNRATELTGKSIEQRIAACLLRLSAQAGTESAEGIHIEFPITRFDLASMAGLTYFTVSRTLSAWQKQGLVKTGRHRLTILKVAHIVGIAEPRIGR